MTKFSKWDVARIKRTAQNVDQYVTKKNKLVAKMEELQAELDEVTKLIDITDAPTVALTGYHSEDLVKKVVIPTDKTDKNGNVIKVTKYELRYPETIIPNSINSKLEEADAYFEANMAIVNDPIELHAENMQFEAIQENQQIEY